MKFLELKTTENSRVFFNASAVAAVEEVPQSGRTEGFLRVYTAGYKFGVKEVTAEELLKALKAETASVPLGIKE